MSGKCIARSGTSKAEQSIDESYKALESEVVHSEAIVDDSFGSQGYLVCLYGTRMLSD